MTEPEARQPEASEAESLEAESLEPEAPAPPPGSISARQILLGSGPRFARDAFGPILAFYVGWKLIGLVAGVALATALSLFALQYERQRERSGAMAKFSLAFVLLQAIIGLASGSARVYLAQPVLLNGALGLLFLVSTAVGRPLAGVFADEMYPFPPEVRASDTFRRVFSRVSIAWGAYMLVRSAVRLAILASTSVDAFVIVNFLTGAPLIAAMMSWSVWYGVRGFRRSKEWGWAFADGADAAPVVPPA